MKRLRLAPYVEQQARWPDRGRLILAQYDEETVVVYQPQPSAVARYAAQRGRLDAPTFPFERTAWIETSFLGMMHRWEWGTRRDRGAMLAIWLRRAAFDALLAQAVPSRFEAGVYLNWEAWQAALGASGVLLQWDPDYALDGLKLRRQALRLGLRGETLRRYVRECIAQVEDISAFVRQQAPFRCQAELLMMPAQRIYPVRDAALARRLGLDKYAPG